MTYRIALPNAELVKVFLVHVQALEHTHCHIGVKKGGAKMLFDRGLPCTMMDSSPRKPLEGGGVYNYTTKMIRKQWWINIGEGKKKYGYERPRSCL